MCRFLRYWWVQTLNQFWRKCDDVGRQTYSGDRFNLRLHAEDSFRIVWYCTRISAVLIDWLIELRFYVPLDTKRSFRRRSSQPIAWRSTEETKPNAAKATRMWANAQRDGALPNIGGTLCSTPQFGWRPLLECHAVTLPRRKTRWNYLGCPKLMKCEVHHIVGTCRADIAA